MENNELQTLVSKFYELPKGKKVFEEFEATLKNEGMLEKIKSGVLVGFSGGADSVMLLCLLHILKRRMDFKIAAVHVNHMIRGEDAFRDEEFSENFANCLEIEFYSRRVDVPSIAKEKKQGTEEAARNLRYQIFHEIILQKEDLSCIATAHNATDNVETVLFNLFRGSGIGGMKGISPVRDNILRPLIRIPKQTICEALDEAGIPYVTDSSNFSDEYTRNLIRNKILPEIRKFSSNPEGAVSRFCSNISEDIAYIDSIANSFVAKNRINDKISVSAIRSLDPSVLSRVVMQLIDEYSSVKAEAIHINSIKNLLKTDKAFSVDIPGNCSFVCDGQFCFVRKRSVSVNESKNEFQIYLKEGLTIISELDIAVLLTKDKSEVFSSNVYKFSIQADLSSVIIDKDLYIRTRREGDAYCYGGMTHKVKRLFSDRKIPKQDRDSIPILCDNKGIVWVAGFPVRSELIKPENQSLWVKIYKKLSTS